MLKHFPRYKDLIWLFIKYGRSDLVKQMNGGEIPSDVDEVKNGKAAELSADLQKMGPTFVKLGQFLSTQADFLSESYQKSLSDLQDNAEPFPYTEVEAIVEKELGIHLKKAFIEFDPVPLAAASLSQVHLAKLHSGKTVAVKIQRPGIKEVVIEDLNMLQELARFFDKNEFLGKSYFWEEKIKSFRTSLLNELDFRKEGRNLSIFKKNLSEFELIVIPSPIPDYTTMHILTMEYISSQKITTIHPLLKMEIEGEKLAEELFKAYLKQIFIDGFVHIDPHPGNVYLTDTKQIALLDLGMVERLSQQIQQDLLKLLLAISEGKGEEVANLVVKLGHKEEDFQYYKFNEDVADLVAHQQNLNWRELSIGRLLVQITRKASENNLRLSPKFNTLGKTLSNLDGVIRALAPQFDFNQFLHDNISPLLEKRLSKLMNEFTFANFSLEVSDFFRNFPIRINDFFDLLTKNEFKIKVDAIDEHRLMIGFEKVANRIALGLVIASMIVGAALLMRIETTFKIFGYPGLAILLFLGAMMGGVIFIFNIIRNDEKQDK